VPEITDAITADPAQKVEIWLFQEVGRTRGHRGKPTYRRLPYNLVRFEGNPTEYVEPACQSDFVKLIDGSGDPIGFATQGDGFGRVVEMRTFKARPFEFAFAYNDVDCSGIGTLP